jgi:hypothetical protein
MEPTGANFSTEQSDPKMIRPYNKRSWHVECKNESDTRGNWNHLKIIQKILE